jgi:hypothetical protein
MVVFGVAVGAMAIATTTIGKRGMREIRMNNTLRRAL